MTVRYYVRFSYYDVEEKCRVPTSLFVDVSKEIDSNEDLNAVKEYLDTIAVKFIPNAKRIRVSDFRLEKVTEGEFQEEEAEWKKGRKRK